MLEMTSAHLPIPCALFSPRVTHCVCWIPTARPLRGNKATVFEGGVRGTGFVWVRTTSVLCCPGSQASFIHVRFFLNSLSIGWQGYGSGQGPGAVSTFVPGADAQR